MSKHLTENENVPCKRQKQNSETTLDDFNAFENLVVENEVDETAHEGILMVVTGSKKENEYPTQMLQLYDIKLNQSNTLAPLTPEIMLTGLSIVMLREKLYVFAIPGKLLCLDTSTSWIGRSDTCSYHDVAAVEMDGSLYALGSVAEVKGMCEKYDPIQNEWTYIGTTKRKSTYCCFIALKGWIYCICRRNLGNVVQDVERFNPSTGTWEDVASINIVNENISATTLNDKIYIVGSAEWGYEPSTVESYDLNTNSWTLLLKSVDSFQVLGLYSVERSLFAVRRTATFSDVAEFDLENATWKKFDQLKNTSLHPGISCTQMKLPHDYFIEIQTTSHNFLCLRKLLVEKSDYFKAMLSAEMNECKTKTVHLAECNSNAIKLCVEYMTSGAVPEITLENLEELIHVARMLFIEDLVEKLIEYCCKSLDATTFEKIKRISYKYDFLELDERCDDFAEENFLAITDSPCFLAMEHSYVKQLLVRSRKQISEVFIVKSALKWIKYDEKERKCHVVELLAYISFSNMKLSSLEEVSPEVC